MRAIADPDRAAPARHRRVPARSSLHELLVRVTADLSVPDGTRIETWGSAFAASRARSSKASCRAWTRSAGPTRRRATRSGPTSRASSTGSRQTEDRGPEAPSGWLARLMGTRPPLKAPSPPSERDLIAVGRARAHRRGRRARRVAGTHASCPRFTFATSACGGSRPGRARRAISPPTTGGSTAIGAGDRADDRSSRRARRHPRPAAAGAPRR